MVQTKIVIVGAGFGGLAAARALRNTPASVVLIDRTNHHLFEPLLYQVGAGAGSNRFSDPGDSSHAEEHHGDPR